MWESVVSHQDDEIAKAITGTISCYRLNEDAMYLSVCLKQLYQWTAEKGKAYLTGFNNLSLDKVRNGKRISIPETHNQIHSLSIKLSIALPLIICANVIERKAIKLLNTKSTIFAVPSLGNDKDDLEIRQYQDTVPRDSTKFRQ